MGERTTMKRSILSACALWLCLALSACGGKAPAPFTPGEDAEALLQSGAFSEALVEIDQDVACLLYGIDENTVTACAVYGSTGTTAEELAIFTLQDADGAEAALKALTQRVEDRRDEMEDYIPGEVSKLDKAVVERREASVLMVVASDYAPVEAFLNG